MRLAAYTILSLRLAVACWLGVLAGGCAMFRDSGPRIDAPAQWSSQVHGAVQDMESALGKQWQGNGWKWSFVAGQRDTPGNRCPGEPFWSRHILGQWRGGQTGGSRNHQATDIYTAPDGSLAPCEQAHKLLWEAGRGILLSHGISGAEAVAEMKRARDW